MKLTPRFLLIICLGWFLISTTLPVQAQSAGSDGVVRAVLFYSPTCGHCEYVITTVLPPLFEQYGDQLQMIGVDVSSESGSVIFRSALEHFQLERAGVPFLVVGDTHLVGSMEIPELFPGLIETFLAQGGVDWPDIPGLDQAINAAYQQATDATTSTTTAMTQETATAVPDLSPEQADTISGGLLADTNQLSLGERLAQDPAGNALAIVVLIGMVALAIWAVVYLLGEKKPLRSYAKGWAIPVLCVVGLCIAGYLAFVETAQVEAVCGPVGDCNTVQQSKYARLFGVLPIGIVGLAGYCMILAAWIFGRFGERKVASLAAVAMLGLTAFGLLFSIYLTFLEPFVIGASCAWCLSSAVIMAALFWLSLPDGKLACNQLRGVERKWAAS